MIVDVRKLGNVAWVEGDPVRVIEFPVATSTMYWDAVLPSPEMSIRYSTKPPFHHEEGNVTALKQFTVGGLCGMLYISTYRVNSRPWISVSKV